MVLYNPADGGVDIGVENQLVLSDGSAHTHLKGETKTYKDAIGKEIKELYPFLINLDQGVEKPKYVEIEHEGVTYYVDPKTQQAFKKEDVDKEIVKKNIELQKLKTEAIPDLPKQAVKVRVDKRAITRHNTSNVLKTFKDPAAGFEGEGLTAD